MKHSANPILKTVGENYYDEISARNKTSLDIAWLKNKSLADLDNLPDPDELTLDIVGLPTVSENLIDNASAKNNIDLYDR